MSDSTVILNPGAGGDSMDVSQVTTTSGTVKRSRSVLGDDDGDLLATDTNRSGHKVLIVSAGDNVFEILEEMVAGQRQILALLEMIVEKL